MKYVYYTNQRKRWWRFTYLLLVGTCVLGLLGFVIVYSEVLIISIIFISNKANFDVHGPSSN